MMRYFCCYLFLSLNVQAEWHSYSRGELPEQPMPVTAIEATDTNTTEAQEYVCRAHYNKGLHPGKITENSKGCIITSAGRSSRRLHYEVLLKDSQYYWGSDVSGGIPEQAMIGGAEDANGDYPLYICRAKWQEKYQVGKILRIARGCKIAAHGRERTVRDFEWLLVSPQKVVSPP